MRAPGEVLSEYRALATRASTRASATQTPETCDPWIIALLIVIENW
jgi:hypothetical protein